MAPMIPHLDQKFKVSEQFLVLIVPVPYGISMRFYGTLSDYFGRHPIMMLSLSAFTLLTLLRATAQTASQLLLWKFATGLGPVVWSPWPSRYLGLQDCAS